MKPKPFVSAAAIPLGWLLTALPPGATLLQSTMTSHMLVQLPLLAAGGWWLGGKLVASWPDPHLVLRRLRWALLVSATGTFGIWMIPRLLDLAVETTRVDAGKAVSLAMLGGLPLRCCWHSLGPVVRGLVHVEALASLWRFGWLYLESPDRLCSRYLINDQHRLGELLMVIGAAYAVWLAWRALGEIPEGER